MKCTRGHLMTCDNIGHYHCSSCDIRVLQTLIAKVDSRILPDSDGLLPYDDMPEEMLAILDNVSLMLEDKVSELTFSSVARTRRY